MRIFKKIKPLVFLLVVVAMNMVLSFILEPARGASEVMWRQYYKEDEIDTLFIGSSLCRASLDPAIVDERLGVKSFNMGTPLQAMPQTVRSLEVAIEDHDIKTVIFAMGFSTFKHEAVAEAELTYEKARAREKGGIEGFLVGLSYLCSEDVRTSEKSVNYLFPWLYNHVDFSKTAIVDNVKQKINRFINPHSELESEADSTYYKGFTNKTTYAVDYGTKWDGVSDRFYPEEMDENMLAEFEKILQICREHEIELIVVNTPHPVHDVVSCHRYYHENEAEVVALCDKYGVDYYDFSLAKREIYDPEIWFYADYEHLNMLGSAHFSERLCDLLIRRANGEDMTPYFYEVREFMDMYPDLAEEWDNYFW